MWRQLLLLLLLLLLRLLLLFGWRLLKSCWLLMLLMWRLKVIFIDHIIGNSCKQVM